MTKYPDKEARMKKFAATEGKDRYSSRRRASEGDYYQVIKPPARGHMAGFRTGQVAASILKNAPLKPNDKDYAKGPYGQIKARKKK